MSGMEIVTQDGTAAVLPSKPDMDWGLIAEMVSRSVDGALARATQTVLLPGTFRGQAQSGDGIVILDAASPVTQDPTIGTIIGPVPDYGARVIVALSPPMGAYILGEAQFIAPVVDNEPWTEVVGGTGLINSWANSGSPYNTAGFYKDAAGWVHLKGTIANGTFNTQAFALPLGYRPAFDGWYRVLCQEAGVHRLTRVNVAGGGVFIHGSANDYVALDGISFPTHWKRWEWQIPEWTWPYKNLNEWTSGLEGAAPELFLRDDGWVYTKGYITLMDTATAGAKAGSLPEAVRTRFSQYLIGAGFGGNTWTNRFGFIFDSLGLWTSSVAGLTSEIYVGGMNWWSDRNPTELDWTYPSFENGWLDGGTPVAYLKDAWGRVHLKGHTYGTSHTADTIFTMPAGFRPAGDALFATVDNVGNLCRIRVNTIGQVREEFGRTTSVSLDGINFRADQ